MSFSHVPMQLEPLELHVVDALGQQDVPDYFQQPAKATTGGCFGATGCARLLSTASQGYN